MNDHQDGMFMNGASGVKYRPGDR